MTANSLRGRTALVTGGSRGIGAAISRALAEAGAAARPSTENFAGCASWSDTSADALLDRTLNKIDELCAERDRPSLRKETMRKNLTILVLLAALTGSVCGTHIEHTTPDELAFSSLQSQDIHQPV
jgi:NAD(P)-dependent dehydrogenase (short-subunit alcohol dehydrogenase family)